MQYLRDDEIGTLPVRIRTKTRCSIQIHITYILNMIRRGTAIVFCFCEATFCIRVYLTNQRAYKRQEHLFRLTNAASSTVYITSLCGFWACVHVCVWNCVCVYWSNGFEMACNAHAIVPVTVTQNNKITNIEQLFHCISPDQSDTTDLCGECGRFDGHLLYFDIDPKCRQSG